MEKILVIVFCAACVMLLAYPADASVYIGSRVITVTKGKPAPSVNVTPQDTSVKVP